MLEHASDIFRVSPILGQCLGAAQGKWIRTGICFGDKTPTSSTTYSFAVLMSLIVSPGFNSPSTTLKYTMTPCKQTKIIRPGHPGPHLFICALCIKVISPKGDVTW